MLAALLLFAGFFGIVLVGTALVIVHDFIAARWSQVAQEASGSRQVPHAARPRPEAHRVRTLGHV